MSPETVVTDAHSENLSSELAKNIKTLKLNYIKWVYDYASMSSQVAKIVKWFPNINEIRLNLNDIPTSCINNIAHHFDEIVKDKFELRKSNTPNTGVICSFEAKNCFLMSLYINPNNNSTVREFFKADTVKVISSEDLLEINQNEEWLKIQSINKIEIEGMRKYDFRDFYQTFYQPTVDYSYFLLRKSEISKISIDSSKSRSVFD